jgi:gentisate 1,2-dioxygenase
MGQLVVSYNYIKMYYIDVFSYNDNMETGILYEYVKAANPEISEIQIVEYDRSLYSSGETRIITLNNSSELNTSYDSSSPNMLVGFIRINKYDKINIQSNATSNAFYVINGGGVIITDEYTEEWSEGDVFVLPYTPKIKMTGSIDSVLYWFNDEPLVNYMKTIPISPLFSPTIYKSENIKKEVMATLESGDIKSKNRTGVLLANKVTDYIKNGGDGSLTLTPTLWCLLNILPAQTIQKPHRHNSIAFDLCTYSPDASKVYTLIGETLDNNGNIVNPQKCYWKTGCVFITPPGLWHSHHNETSENAWVLPVQDAGIYTYQRTLDIRFSR